jgi:hypothetical protein
MVGRREKLRILGECFGAEIIEREGHAPLVQMLVEDDENWHEEDMSFDSSWIDDIIDVLTMARVAIGAK